MDLNILVTAPPMLGMQSQFIPLLHEYGVQVSCPDVVQVMSEDELVRLLPNFDGWIIGDDPATRRVFEAGRSKTGRLLKRGKKSPIKGNILRFTVITRAD